MDFLVLRPAVLELNCGVGTSSKGVPSVCPDALLFGKETCHKIMVPKQGGVVFKPRKLDILQNH